MPFVATLMDLEIFMLSEVCQIEKERYHMTSLIGRKRNYTNELIYEM